MFGVPFDLDRLEVRGTPSPVLEEVGYNLVDGSAQCDASGQGALVFRRGISAGEGVTLEWLDASGKTEALPPSPAPTPNRTCRPMAPHRRMTDEALATLAPALETLYSTTGRPSIPPEQLLRALRIQAL